MAPVSRGRKKKSHVKSKKSARRVPSPAVEQRRMDAAHALLERETRETPTWFDQATSAVLASSAGLVQLGSPREVEDAVVRALGEQLHRVLAGDAIATPFDRWFAELVDHAADAVHEGLERGDGWRPALRLLYGLASSASGSAREQAEEALANAQMALRGAGLEGDEPRWLRAAARVRTSGQLWQMTDRFGGRFGLFAELDDRSGRTGVYAWDVDVCSMPVATGGGWFDDIDAATTWWREHVGAAADGEPDPAPDLGPLSALTSMLHGGETRIAVDEFFRHRRRIEDLEAARREPDERDGEPWKPDVSALAGEFDAWLRRRGIDDTDSDLLEGFVREAVMGDVGPDGVASAHRASHLYEYLNDDVDPHDAAFGVFTALMPLWFRFRGEARGLSEAEFDRVAAVAKGAPLDPDDCPGAFTR
jgi:hypothetical protein